MEPPSVSYCEAFQLASWLRGLEKEGLVVLDVRDDDFEEIGHVRGCHHAPSSSLSDEYAIDALIDGPLAKASRVVVHCMFSQQRGPRTALRLAGRYASRGLPGPAVLVLRGGFERFGRLYFGEQDLVEPSAAP